MPGKHPKKPTAIFINNITHNSLVPAEDAEDGVAGLWKEVSHGKRFSTI